MSTVAEDAIAITPAQFAKEVEDLVWDLDISYIDSVIMLAEKKSLEVETIAELVHRNEDLKAKIELEGESLHLLPRVARLPVF